MPRAPTQTVDSVVLAVMEGLAPLRGEPPEVARARRALYSARRAASAAQAALDAAEAELRVAVAAHRVELAERGAAP